MNKKVTIYTLAEELNMTPSMVSRGLSPNGKVSKENREKILKVAEKYNYKANKHASRLSMKTLKIGVLIHSEKRVVLASVFQDVFKQSKTAFEKFVRYSIDGEQVEKEIFTNINLITKSNLHIYARS